MALPFSDPVLIFATVMVLILVSPIVARRLKLPDIVGLILAGMLVGPHGLGWLARDDTIALLGKVGLLFIMFICGLEIDLHRANRQRTHSIGFGLLTFMIPLSMGTLLGVTILGMPLTSAILLASMFSSHTLLTVPIVGRLGLAKSRAVTTAIGGTIITDTLALLVLAVIAAGVAGSLSVLFWAGLTLKIVVYMAAVILLAPLAGRWFLRHFSTDETIEFVSVLAITFTASYLAHVAGLEPIIGAFLAGLTLNSLIPEKSGLMAKLHFTGESLFIPFFLLSVGMLVDLRLLWSGVETWKTAIVMISVALFTKWLAARLAAKMLGYSSEEAGMIFGLSVNQAAATLAAAMVGHRIGLFDDGIITGTIMMIGVTCMVGPLVTEKFGRLLAVRAHRDLEDVTSGPRRILLPINGKERAKELLDLSIFLRGSASQEPLYPIHVVLDGPRAEADIAHGENLVAHTVIRSLSANVPVNPLIVVDLNIPSGLLRAARENRASIITMFWDGRHPYRSRAFGAIIDRVISDSTQTILVNRILHNVSTAKRILLLCAPFTSLQPGFSEALGTIKAMAKQCGARLVLVVDKPACEEIERYAENLRPHVPLECIAYTDWKSILEVAEATLEANDWIMTLAARMGQVAWQPSSERLPAQMAQRFPEHNLSFVYPPAEAEERAMARQTGPSGQLAGILRAKHCLLAAKARDLHTILVKLLTPLLGHNPRGLASTIHSLQAIAVKDPVELEPGIVLLHDHSAYVTTSTIFLATARDPIPVQDNVEPFQTMIVLLDPDDQDPARHLAALGRVAALIHIPGFKESISLATSFEDLEARLAAFSAKC